MEQSYTSIQLIQFIYGESDLFTRLEIEDALLHDSTLKSEYQELYDAYKSIPKVRFSPSKAAINNVLAYANKQMSATA